MGVPVFSTRSLAPRNAPGKYQAKTVSLKILPVDPKA
jgi:hypothetical protein